MSIYAYRCGACGHANDVLQELFDLALAQRPACHALTLDKRLMTASFQRQRQGARWYTANLRGTASLEGLGA